MAHNPFSELTTDVLGGWLSGGDEITEFPLSVIEELAPYRSKKDLKLYRSVTEKHGISDIGLFTHYTSWSKSIEVVENFSEDTNRPIVSSIIPHQSIVVDTTMINPKIITIYLGGFPEEEEVIVFPGNYDIVNL